MRKGSAMPGIGMGAGATVGHGPNKAMGGNAMK